MTELRIRMKGDHDSLSTMIDENMFTQLKSLSEDDLKASRLTWNIGLLYTQLLSYIQTEDGTVIRNTTPLWEEVDITMFTEKSNEEFAEWIKEKGFPMHLQTRYHPKTGKVVFFANYDTAEATVTLYGETLAELFIRFYYYVHTSRILRTDYSFTHFVDKWVYVQQFETYAQLEEAKAAYFERTGVEVEKKIEETQGKVDEEAEVVSEIDNSPEFTQPE